MNPFLLSILLATLVYAANPSKLVIAYVTDWSAFSVTSIDFNLVTNVHFAFANLAKNGTVLVPESLTPSFINTAHTRGAKVSLAVGGWGLTPFSDVFSTSTGRNNTIKSLKQVVTSYGLDGIEIDWEWPGNANGANGTVFRKEDTTNYLVFLKGLRASLGSKSLISVCVGITPFVGMSLVELAAVVDFVMVMAYDINGQWNSISGPNAPLQVDSSRKNPGSVADAILTWQLAGFPSNKIVLGLAFYGRGTFVTESMANNAATNETAFVRKSVTQQASATYTYLQILKFLNDTTASFVSKYDSYTQTPWLFNKATMQYISYDNALSITVKSQFAGCLGLRGVAAWDISLDGGQAGGSAPTFCHPRNPQSWATLISWFKASSDHRKNRSLDNRDLVGLNR
ncbi:glycoside hydrolase [Rhizoclosmatium globosum]|uniref:Glycoside hydrolase n=1 Tax=Rhizoclosmatium globosum TaxID=329046 RepID=A0A1Y2D0V8_9FUNG|nr:glycoside hydrolase [Rhizoclosmatium globosum]|eukprot:ORY52923.1 glycoside hydrolase [Rhizoclosmatium globosum]